MAAFGAVKGKLAYEALETTRFVKANKLTAYRFNPNFPMNTLMIMRGMVAAEMDGDPAPYVECVLAAMWEDGKKMDDPQVVAAVLADAGLNAPQLLARIQTPEVKAKLANNTEAAAARGVFGIPTFFVGEEMFFGKERLGQVEAELA
jgi:2-hydroxychromene-2-carboxylate isomerase